MKNRHSLRLRHYDYSLPGYYFVTICTYRMNPLFGFINNGKMILNAFGQIACNEWQRSEIIRREIRLDQFVVMPNHLHGIVIIEDAEITRQSARGHGVDDAVDPPNRTGDRPSGRGDQPNRGSDRLNRTGDQPNRGSDRLNRTGDQPNRTGDRPVAPADKPITPAAPCGPTKKSLGSLIAGFKSIVTKQINQLRQDRRPVWHRNYHDHVIRDERALHNMRAYIQNNPCKWECDTYHPAKQNKPKP